MNDTLYQELADFYWLYSSKKCYEKEANFISWIFKKYNIPGKNILDIGCGQGNHMLYLKKKGYNVLGIDKSAKQIQIARKKHPQLHFKRIDFLEYNSTKKYDGIIMLWNTILYFSPMERLSLVLKKINKSLKTRGILIFDFKDFLNYILLNEFKFNLERKLVKDDYCMKLETKNEEDIFNQVIIEKTKSKIYYKNRLLKNYEHKPVILNILTIPSINLLLENSGLKLLNVFDAEALFENNPKLNLMSKTKAYVVVANKITS